MSVKNGKHSRRYGKRFSAPYDSWPCGHRRNPTRQTRGRRRPAAVVVKGKA